MTTKPATRAVVDSPCAECPFLVKHQGEGDYLRPGRRAGIVRDMLEGSDFPCHKTIDHEDDECDGESDACVTGGVTCAGAALVMLRAGHEGPLKMAMRLGMINPDEFEARNAKVKLWTLRECLDETRDEVADEEEGTCNVVLDGCEAPAGWLIGGEVVHGDILVDTRCPVCGEFVCDNCSDAQGRCLESFCSEDAEDE